MHKGASKIITIIGIVIFISLPIIALAIGFGIMPQGGTFTPVQGAAPIITGEGCTKYMNTKLTAYWTPDSNAAYGNDTTTKRLEGGPLDRKSTRNHTLKEFIAGNYIKPTSPLSNYSSLAGDATADSPVKEYGVKVYIPSIEQALNQGKEIIFRVVDTGGDFVGKGATRLDVAVATKSEMNQAALNATTDIWVGDGCKHEDTLKK